MENLAGLETRDSLSRTQRVRMMMLLLNFLSETTFGSTLRFMMLGKTRATAQLAQFLIEPKLSVQA